MGVSGWPQFFQETNAPLQPADNRNNSLPPGDCYPYGHFENICFLCHPFLFFVLSQPLKHLSCSEIKNLVADGTLAIIYFRFRSSLNLLECRFKIRPQGGFTLQNCFALRMSLEVVPRQGWKEINCCLVLKRIYVYGKNTTYETANELSAVARGATSFREKLIHCSDRINA